MSEEQLNKAAGEYATSQKRVYRDMNSGNITLDDLTNWAKIDFKAGWKARDSQPLPDMKELETKFYHWVYTAFGSPRLSGPEEKVIWKWFERELVGNKDASPPQN